MKTVFNHSELAHVWAQQKQEHGKGPRMFFEGTRIYSYGRHFIIANFIRPDVVLFNSNKYSVSTSKHQSYVRGAIHTAKVFKVPYPEGNHIANLEYYLLSIKNLIFDATQSRVNTYAILCNAEHTKSEALEYAKLFKSSSLKVTKAIKRLKMSSPELEEKVISQREKARIKEEKQNAEKATAYTLIRDKDVPDWLSGLSGYGVNILPESYLRVKDDRIETSHGATVSLESGKLLFERINAGKDVIGHEIESYTVISMNGVLKIGCHVIERTEIERFAKTQNWI